MAKILIASDLHGSIFSSQKIVELDKVHNFEKIILLGDINYSGARNIPPKDYYPITVCENLLKLKDKLIVIRGNCDSRVDEFVLGLKFDDLLEVNLNSHHVYLTHGDLFNEENLDLKENDILMYGHTHIYVLKKESKGYFVLNPGSLTLPKNNNPKTYAIYDLDLDSISIFDVDDKTIKTLELEWLI